MKRDQYASLKATTMHNLRKLQKLDPASEEYAELMGEICEANMGLVYKKVEKFSKGQLNYNIVQDLAAAGREGLLHAIMNFDLSKKFNFSPYASQNIFGFIMKFINKSSDVPLPSGMAAAMAAARAKRVYLCKDKKSPLYGKYAFLDRKGVELECDPAIIEIARGSISVELLNEVSADGVHEMGSEEFENSSLATDSIKQALDSLDERDQVILSMRYEQEEKFKKIAEQLKVSIARVQQLEQRAVERFRTALLKYGVSV